MPLLPAGLFYALFFGVPMLSLLVISLWRAQGFNLIPDFTFANYQKIIVSDLYRGVLLRTVSVGLIAAAIVVPVAFTLAYIMRFVFERRGQLILQLVMLSLFSGYLVRIYAWRTILGKQGLLNSALQWLGLIEEPLEFLIYSQVSVVVTPVELQLPLAVLPLYSAMLNVPRDHLEAARDLGASPFHLLRTVLIPMVMPGVRTAFAFAFLLAAGDYVTPTLVGGTQSVMIGNIIADQFRGTGTNWPLGAAMAFIVVGVTLLLYLAITQLIRWVTKW